MRRNDLADAHSSLKRQRLRAENGFISFLAGLFLVAVITFAGLLFEFLSFATPSEIKELRGRGAAQAYDSPPDEVFQTAMHLINQKGLAVVESNERNGYIIAAEGSEFFYEGRIIALFFTSECLKDHVRVEVVSKFMALPSIKELLFPKNGASQILSDLGEFLVNAKGEK